MRIVKILLFMTIIVCILGAKWTMMTFAVTEKGNKNDFKE